MYWSQLIVLDNFEVDVNRKHALAPDIVEELEQMWTEGVEGDEDEWRPLFDPDDFTQANQPLSLDRFRLTEDELKSWAERLSRLRASITERANSLANVEPEAVAQEPSGRSRRGHKRSMPKHNVDGESEAALREQNLKDKAPRRNFKRRHRKDLSEQEVNEIVALSNKPGQLK